MKVAIYTRVSTQMQADKGISLDAQKNELIEYCNKNNYDYDIFEDAGISGKSISKRKQLQKLLNNLQNYDVVLCYKLSRISRSVKDLANMLDIFNKNNVRFISLKEQIDTSSPTGKMLIYIMGVVSEIERDNISEYVKMAKKQEFESGRVTAKAVLGYDIINKQLVLNEQESPIVKFIFETYNKTHNYYKTAQICNKKGFRGKKGNEFHASSIKTIIQNQIYCGFNNFHNEESKKGKHKAIITENLYKKVNSIA